MNRSVEEVVAKIDSVSKAGFRGRLLARGQARNLIWSEGKLPEGSIPFSLLLTSDLLSYGIGLLQLGLELRTLDRSHPKTLLAFELAAEAFEAVIRNGDPDFNERGFYAILAAASYHLGHFSALAFSLLPTDYESQNFSPAERGLSLLIKRDLVGLRKALLDVSGPNGFDQSLSDRLRAVGKDNYDDVAVSEVLNNLYYQALARFDFAVEAGSQEMTQSAVALIEEGIAIASACRAVPLWWIFSITRHLFDDLWGQSLHVRLPQLPDQRWQDLRWLFIATLLNRSQAEIELWPSQLAAAERAVAIDDDLIAALPTSAGKTRIAELCILRALSTKKRVVFVTPLRALSAQTERSLRQTFEPLGFTVSSLYGSSGTTGDDADSLANRDIVISTPEKLDFALRNNAEILDHVGLVVLDEAHSIGAGEREVHYEVLVQRLLRRADGSTRRIVCLSAILPQGEQLDDFVSWIRQDEEGTAVSNDWRPTRQCFGKICWSRGESKARLAFNVQDGDPQEAPFVDGFIRFVPPRGKQRTPLPRDRRDLSLLTAWKLVEEKKTVLLYCPERRSVIPLAEVALDLVRRGYLPSLLDIDRSLINDALHIGEEWLGASHPAVRCLEIGIAVHHGHLPRPFLRAVEGLLKARLLNVTISSPTLAQGLNLSATTVLFTGLKRWGKTIPGEEFANVAGRAGRAFIDVEGQALCVVWEPKHEVEWKILLKDARKRNLESGLYQLIMGFCKRIADNQNCSLNTVFEYILRSADSWIAPTNPNIDTEEALDLQQEFELKWDEDLACLDTALLSLVQHDVQTEDLAAAIDEALTSSLWQRTLVRQSSSVQVLVTAVLKGRGNYIWKNSTPTQRKGYFFAGVSFKTGQYLDEYAGELEALLISADDSFASGEVDEAIAAIIRFAEIAFGVTPFTPREMIEDWHDVVKNWGDRKQHGRSRWRKER